MPDPNAHLLFLRMRAGRRRVFMSLFAVLMRRVCVMRSVCVLTSRVVVLGLMMMMGGRMVMRSGGVMVLLRGMLW